MGTVFGVFAGARTDSGDHTRPMPGDHPSFFGVLVEKLAGGCVRPTRVDRDAGGGEQTVSMGSEARPAGDTNDDDGHSKLLSGVGATALGTGVGVPAALADSGAHEIGGDRTGIG